MTSSPFTIEEHTFDTSYMREYPRGAWPQNAPLKLAIKKYIPADNLNPQPGNVTLIGAHGAGFPKELYEPLWEELLARSKANGFRIRAIWVADVANQGASGVLNEKYLGNDPSWIDHSRDLLHMINHFRDDMPQPIMGVGHSMGAVHLMFLSYLHPRLLRSLVLIEPYVWDNYAAADGSIMALTANKRDIWSHREAAVKRGGPFFRIWDPRVVERWVQHGYRDLPTVTHPDHPKVNTENAPNSSPQPNPGPSVTLTTTKHQEAFAYARFNPNQHRELGLSDSAASREANGPPPPHDPLFFPDVIGDLYPNQVFYRAETVLAWRGLPHIRPSTLFLSAGKSNLFRWGMIGKAASIAGTGIGGSGGMPYERVKHVVLPKAFHTLPLEKVASTADTLAPWISKELQRWNEDERRIAEGWETLSSKERSTLSGEWVAGVSETLKNVEARKKTSKL